jgi:hypothetical protein
MRDQRIKVRNYHAVNAHMRSSAGSMKEKRNDKDKYICRDPKECYRELEEDYGLNDDDLLLETIKKYEDLDI